MAGCELCKRYHKDPRYLPCEHCFCFQCLHEYILKVVTKTTMNYFPCPTCHVYVQAPIADTHAKTWAAFFPKDRLVSSCTLTLLKQKEFAENNKASICSAHEDKTADLYCKTCQTLVCLECIEDSHPRPKCDTVTAEKMAEILHPDLEKLQTQLSEQQLTAAEKFNEIDSVTTDKDLLLSKIQTLKNLDLIQSLMSEARAKALEQIRDLRKLCENVYSELDKKKEVKTKVFSLLNSTNLAKDMMETASKTGNPEDILKALPHLTFQANQHDIAISCLQTVRETPRIKYTINPEMEKFLRKFSEVGVLKYETSSDGLSDNVSDIMEASDKCPEQLTFLPKLDGEKRCGIEGAAITDNRIILTDRDSRSLKLFSLAGSLIDQLTLAFCPRRVAPVAKTGEVVVTHSKERALTFVATHPSLKVLRKTRTGKCYSDITDMGDKYLAASNCSDLTLDILELDGHVLKRIRLDFDQNGACAFSWPWFVCTTSGGKILISDRDKGLFCLNVSGEMVFAYQPPGIQPRGVRVDADGTIYLARGDNNTVERLSRDGKLQDVSVTRRDNVKLPTCLCLSNRRLIVTQYEGNGKVHVFKI